ncbi:MAG: hypothetical protein ACYCTV_07765 [Leptospirales bacterium]
MVRFSGQRSFEENIDRNRNGKIEVRFPDRFFDLHVTSAVQHAVNGALTGDPVKRQEGLAQAAE